MNVVQCPKCFAGNSDVATSCHHCGARVMPGKKGTVVGGEVTVADEYVHDAYILDTAMAAQRSREARTARLMLTIAAVLYFLRISLVPFLQAFMQPDKFAPFAGPHVTPHHYACFVVFAVCAVWARREPLTATLTAGVLFLFAAVPGLLENPTIMGGALVGKLLMLLVVWRAVSAAIVYRINCGRPEVHQPVRREPMPNDRIAA